MINHPDDLIQYDDILYVCLNCGWDEFDKIYHEISDPLPKVAYWTYICQQCEAEHINSENFRLLETKP